MHMNLHSLHIFPGCRFIEENVAKYITYTHPFSLATSPLCRRIDNQEPSLSPIFKTHKTDFGDVVVVDTQEHELGEVDEGREEREEAERIG